MNEEQHPGLGASLDTVIIFTEHMEELADFYRQAFQLGPFQSSPDHLGQQVGAVYFGFDQVKRLETGPDPAVTLWFAVDDLQTAFDRLVAMGAEVRYPPTSKPWGAFLAAVYDPDGNLLGLAQRQPAG